MDYISIAGTAVTLASMGISILQAKKARKASKDAEKILIAVNMTSVAERLKTAQEHIRGIAPEKLKQRGFNPEELINSIHKEFDAALNDLSSSGEGSEARKKIVKAQSIFDSYCSSKNMPNRDLWIGLRQLIQDAISTLTSNKTGG